MESETEFDTVSGLCMATDPSTCDHEHRTLWDSDPLIAALAEAVERNGIKRGGITYGER